MKIINGFAFPLGALAFGFIMLVSGFGVAAKIPWVGILMMFISGFICFTMEGLQVDFEKETIRTYVTYYGFKVGKWESLSDYPYISILSGRKRKTLNSRSGAVSSDSIDKYYNVYLLGKNHRKKFLIIAHESMKEAQSSLDEYSKRLNKKEVKYEPKISKKTRNRRR